MVALRKKTEQVPPHKGGKTVPASPLSPEHFEEIVSEAGTLYQRHLSGELKETRLQKRMKSGL